MRRYWIPALMGLCLLMLGAVSIGDRFVINIYQWVGLSSDELFGVDLGSASDMANFEVMSEGNTTFLQQRGGVHRITPKLSVNSGYPYAATICQLQGDFDRFVIAYRDSFFYQAEAYGADTTKTWEKVLDSITGLAYKCPSRPFTTFLQFKDTLIATGADSIYRMCRALTGGSDFRLIKEYTYVWPYGRILLHQNRIYGYGIRYNGSTNENRLVWMPEYSLRFDSVATIIGGGFLYVAQDDGDFLTNVVPMGGNLVAYKSHSIYTILISSTSNSPSEVQRVSDNIGAVMYDCVAVWNGQHFFVAQDGVYRNDGSRIEKISRQLDPWFADSIYRTAGVAAVYSRTSSLVAVGNRLYFSCMNSAQKARVFVYDLQLGTWWKMIATDNTTDNIMQLLRYDYQPNFGYSFSSNGTNGTPFYTSRLVIVRDSVGTNCQWYPWTGYQSDNGARPWATFTSTMSPIKDMWDRKQLDRAALFGSALAACSVWVDWYAEANTLIDSTAFLVNTTPRMSVRRLPSTVSGSLLKYRIRVKDTLQVKINALELIGTQRGLKIDE